MFSLAEKTKMEKVEILQNVTISRRLATGETPGLQEKPHGWCQEIIQRIILEKRNITYSQKKARHHTLKFLSLLLVRKAQKAAKIEREN